jgi:hypothetical protein
MVPRWLVQVLHPPQKFERPPFCNGWRYGIKKYGFEVTFNGMTSLLNFIKIYRLVQKLLGGPTNRRTDRQTGDLTSLTFLFKEIRLTRKTGRESSNRRRLSWRCAEKGTTEREFGIHQPKWILTSTPTFRVVQTQLPSASCPFIVRCCCYKAKTQNWLCNRGKPSESHAIASAREERKLLDMLSRRETQSE